MWKEAISISIIILVIFPKSVIAEWDPIEKTIFGVFTGALVMDCFQTRYKYDHSPEQYIEKNPITEWGSDEFGSGFVYFYSGAGLLLTYGVANQLKPKWRKTFLIAITSVQLSVVSHNHKIGVGWHF